MITTFKPALLKWARLRAGLDREAIAKKVLGKNGDAEKVREWEETGKLTFHNAEVLAQKTYTPFGYLFLDDPPREELPIKDFRTIQSGGIQDNPSPALLDVIYQCQRRQEWYREFSISERAEPLDFVGSGTVRTPATDMATAIANRLKIGFRLSGEVDSWQENLTLHFEAAEEARILVMRNGIVGNNVHRKLSLNEFRGFALSDQYAPLVFINSLDAYAAQLFTLVHEIAHIWLGESAVSNPVRTYAHANEVERYCNEVAAEVLIPLQQFTAEWNTTSDSEEEIRRIAGKYKVSTLVASRRALDAGFLTQADFRAFYDSEVKRFLRRKSEGDAESKERGGNFHNSLKARVGDRFCRAIIANTLEGKTPYTEAFRLLDLKNTKSFESFTRARFPHLMHEVPPR